DVDRIVAALFLEAKARDRNVNLADVSNRILSGYLERSPAEDYRAAILDLYARVLNPRARVADDETDRLIPVLKLSGIIRATNGVLRVRNRIYERVFDRDWIQAHMPDAELARQRTAFR